MIFAGIDIGSNAVRILFSDMFGSPNTKITSSKVSFIRVPLRLGEDVFSLGYIKEESKQKLIDTLRAFKQLIDVYGAVDFTACATAAMREAQNSKEVIEDVYKNTGIKIKVIDGLEEASIIRMAGETQSKNNAKIEMFVDVGGGSTEISVNNHNKLINSYSFQLGTLRLLNKVDSIKEWEKLENWLKEFSKDFKKISIIGSGGNINKITKIFGDSANRYIELKQLKKAANKLEKLTIEERMEEYKLRADRADVILPAAKLFLFIGKIIKVKRIEVPKFGLADGLVCKLYKDYYNKHNRHND